MLGCSVMSAGWNVLAHHSADRLRALPIHVALMGPGLQRQPLGALLAAAMHATRTTMARRNAGLTISVSTTVDRVVDDAVDGTVVGSAPDGLTVVLFRREFEPMFVEPQEGLSRATEFFDFVKHQCNRLLHAPIRILLEPVAYLDVADWRSDNELSTPHLLVSCRQRSLAQEIELILVEAAFQPQ